MANLRSPEERPAAQLPETPESLVFGGIQAGIDGLTGQSPPQADEDEDAEDAPPADDETGDEPDDGAGESDEDETAESGEPPEGTKPTRPQRTAEEWRDVLLKEGAQRIANVPRAMQAEVIASYGEARARAAAAAAEANIANSLKNQERMRQFIEGVDKQFAEDPDGKLAWLESPDPNADLYRQAKRVLAQYEGVEPEERVRRTASYNERAQRQYDRLAKFPEAQAEVMKRLQSAPSPYTATDEGMAALERDVDALLEENLTRSAGNGAGQGAQSGKPPARRPARPVVSPGQASRPAGKARDISKITDPDELFTVGIAEQMKQVAGA